MSKMREAFETWWAKESHRTKYPKDHPVYLAAFEGYKAAIAAVKEGGAIGYAHHCSDNDDREFFTVTEEPDHPLAVHNGSTPLYKLPEDEK